MQQHILVDIGSKAMGLLRTYGTYLLQHNIHITYQSGKLYIFRTREKKDGWSFGY
jgi:hypothetical protein